MARPAHFEWPVRPIAPSRPAVRSGSACPWLALRAAVLRLAFRLWALPGTAAWFFPFMRLVPLAADDPGLIVWRVRRLSTARCLTLPSRGRAPASRVTPLMSNVGHHGRFAMLSPLLSVRYKSQCRSVCVASRRKSPGPEASHVPLPLAGQSVPCGHHQGFALQKAAYGHSRSLRWPVRFIGPVRPAVRSGSASPWLALRATVLRLAVSQLRAADIGGGRWVCVGWLRAASRLVYTERPGYSALGHA
jgi:hypothetical protein